jgi:hypothetical protein
MFIFSIATACYEICVAVATVVAIDDAIYLCSALYVDVIIAGAATAAYNIGVTLQKIKHFGGWSTESSVVLDYIDPIALA